MVAKPCPGSKIRSAGKGRGLGTGGGQGPLGIPIDEKEEELLRRRKKPRIARPGR